MCCGGWGVMPWGPERLTLSSLALPTWSPALWRGDEVGEVAGAWLGRARSLGSALECLVLFRAAS